jgi:hypothetical protein
MGLKMTDSARYRAFTRTWWRHNSAWPNGLEPGAGRKTTLARNLSHDEAKRLCADWNATHKPGRLSRKAEFEQQ